jgi:hypothetical protein
LAKVTHQQDFQPVQLAARPQLVLISAEPLDFVLHHSLGFLQPVSWRSAP